MWRMEIVSQGKVVAEHSNVTVASKDFWIPATQSVAQGYGACDAEGNAIEYVCGDHGEKANIELTAEGLVTVKGLWAHFENNGGAHHSETGYYYGVAGEDGRVTKLEDLPGGWDSPQLHRQWNLHWLDGRGAALPVTAQAAAELQADAPISELVGALGTGSRSVI